MFEASYINFLGKQFQNPVIYHGIFEKKKTLIYSFSIHYSNFRRSDDKKEIYIYIKYLHLL